MPLRLIILGNDGRGARTIVLGSVRLAIALLILLAALGSAAWAGWKLGELTVH